MSHHTVAESERSVEENVHARAYHIDDLRELDPEWETLSNEEKYHRLKAARERDAIDPIYADDTHNITCVGLDELTVDAFDPAQQRPVVEKLAIGTGTATPAHSNRSLNNEEERYRITTIEDGGTELIVATFLGTNMANGLTITEVGLYSKLLLNHSLVRALEKDNTVEATYEIRLQFTAGSTA